MHQYEIGQKVIVDYVHEDGRHQDVPGEIVRLLHGLCREHRDCRYDVHVHAGILHEQHCAILIVCQSIIRPATIQ